VAMQNHRPARARRKRVHIALDAAIHIYPTHNGPADGGAMLDESPWDRGSAIHAALMTALTRLLTRFLLAATLLLLAGLLPAATLLLIRARVALLRLVRLRLVRVAHALSPQGLNGLPPCGQRMEPQKVATQNEQCACEFRAISTPIPPKFRRELKAGHTRL
jgi:hypothetical protein